MSNLVKNATLPAGDYWVGDLCYVLSDECWKEVCGLLSEREDAEGCGDGTHLLSDGRLVGIVSVPGDGIYKWTSTRRFPVDSGTIGCILLDSIVPPEREGLGHVVKFRSPGSCYFNEDDQEIVLGPVCIPVEEEE